MTEVWRCSVLAQCCHHVSHADGLAIWRVVVSLYFGHRLWADHLDPVLFVLCTGMPPKSLIAFNRIYMLFMSRIKGCSCCTQPQGELVLGRESR